MDSVSITYDVNLPLLIQKAILKCVERDKFKGEYYKSLDEWRMSFVQWLELSPDEGKVTNIALVCIVIDIDYIPVIPSR